MENLENLREKTIDELLQIYMQNKAEVDYLEKQNLRLIGLIERLGEGCVEWLSHS